jgi:hypothetical protein
LVVAFGELCFFALSDGTFFYVMLRRNGRGLRDLVEVLRTPVIFSTLAVGLGIVFDLQLGRYLPPGRAMLIVRIAAVSVVTLGAYAMGLMFFAASTWGELVDRFLVMMKR